MALIDRYKGRDGKRLLIEALRLQSIVDGDEMIARKLCSVADLRQYDDGERIISQGDHDNDLVMILSGGADVIINGRTFASRTAGQHVGDMALIDPAATRSASILSIGTTVVARIPEAEFTSIANDHPRLWRLIGIGMAERMRQLFNVVRPKNEQPVIFIGSSKESLSIANEIHLGFKRDKFNVRLWADSVFLAGYSTMESLEAQLADADFAILVLSSDDKVVSRHDESLAPRDNVIFELGLFAGALTRYRTIIVTPGDIDIKMPTDLLGITYLTYDSSPTIEMGARIAPVCRELRKLIHEHGAR